MNRPLKRYIVLFIIIMCLPLIQMVTGIIKIKPIKGAVELTKPPELNLSGLLNNDFQNKTELFFNDNIGFRPFFIRVRNQISYSLFGQAKARGVIQGKNNYLYELNYIKAYNGEDFLGSDSIDAKIQRMKNVQYYLDSLDKQLIICLAAGKGSFYPEYFPEKHRKPLTDSTNYKVFSRRMKDSNLKVIDFNAWFLQMKDTSHYPLYPKYGIHWSYYGMLLATDSLIKNIEQLENIDIPGIEIEKFNQSKLLKHTDYDIAEGMNLLFQMESEPMCYPQFKWEKGNNKTQPKVLVIADSFYWGMFNIGVASDAFSLGGFWFYYKQAYPKVEGKSDKVNELNLHEEINNIDIIIVMATEATLPKIGWGFFDDPLFTTK